MSANGKKKTALVLSGGGARGAYEAGVWQALTELGIEIDIITGTSVGAINAAMIAQGELELACNLWKEMETHMVFDVPEGSQPFDYAREIVFNHGAGTSGLKELMEKYIDEEKVRNHLSAAKDVDGITDVALGGLFTGNMLGFPPCTAEAAMTILKYYGVEIAGKKAVVIGRSLVVGKPVAMMLMAENATVTVCHSRTPKEDLQAACLDADIIICATGKINTLTADCVNGKQVVIDVGINFDEDGKMCGDDDFEAVKNNVKAITPVPGGVGGVTTALLMHHTVAAAEAASNAL